VTEASNDSVDGVNKRAAKRRAFLWKCSVPVMGSVNKGFIMNMSLSGAKVKMKVPFPKGFEGEIDMPKLSMTFEFIVIWNSGDAIGIRFKDTPQLTASEFRGLFKEGKMVN